MERHCRFCRCCLGQYYSYSDWIFLAIFYGNLVIREGPCLWFYSHLQAQTNIFPSSGNVGIGTLSSTENLTVRSNSQAGNIRIGVQIPLYESREGFLVICSCFIVYKKHFM